MSVAQGTRTQPPDGTSSAEALRRRYDRATAELDPPLALVDLDAFDANAADLTRRAAGRPIRVASKSLRCRYLIERALAQPGYQGVMCYSLPEALWLYAAGTSDDLLVAYPTVNRVALRALAADEGARRHITIMVDSAAHLDVVDQALGDGHPEIRVCLELDVSWRPLAGQPLVHIGTRRSPVFTPRQAADVARTVTGRPGFRLVGLMGYEGQIAGLGDAPPGQPVRARLIRGIQDRSAAELRGRRTEAVRLIQALTSLEFVNGGGTGSLETTAGDESVTELTAGSGLVGPTLFDAYRRFTPDPALLFALPVVRRPGPHIATRNRHPGPAAATVPAGRPDPDRRRGRRRGPDSRARRRRRPAAPRRPRLAAPRQGRRAGRALHRLLRAPRRPGHGRPDLPGRGPVLRLRP
jgi:D-serine deaminase-like pyridoxal phosphate-dependent protein